jgi:acyl transferase domain-containing protein
MLLSCLTYISTLNMEVTCSSETSDGFQGTTRRYILEDRSTLRNHLCEDLKSYRTIVVRAKTEIQLKAELQALRLHIRKIQGLNPCAETD